MVALLFRRVYGDALLPTLMIIDSRSGSPIRRPLIATSTSPALQARRKRVGWTIERMIHGASTKTYVMHLCRRHNSTREAPIAFHAAGSIRVPAAGALRSRGGAESASDVSLGSTRQDVQSHLQHVAQTGRRAMCRITLHHG